jgi:hypothetical protein
MKKLLSLFVFLPTFLFAQETGWYIKKPNADIFEISTIEELIGLRQLVAYGIDNFEGKIIRLVNNIPSDGNYWTPIGSHTRSFQGIFDGQGYTIEFFGTRLSDGATLAGLFGRVGANGQLKNINVIVSEIGGLAYSTSEGAAYAGGLVAYYESEKPIENCSVRADSVYLRSGNTGAVDNGNRVVRVYSGGLVGYASGSITIINSYADLDVSSLCTSFYRACFSYSGGLVGYANSVIITNSYTNRNVSASSGNGVDSYSGGLVGYVINTSTVTNSYTSGKITRIQGSTYSGGGIFGRWNGGSNTSVYYNSAGAIGNLTGISGISNDNLKKQTTFINWDFENIWSIVEGYSYPYLKIFLPPKVYIPLTSNIEAEYIYEQTYTGAQIKPEPTIRLKNDGTLLKKDIDYTLNYGTNKNIGIGTVSIAGINSYSDFQEETISFVINKKTLTVSDATVTAKTYDGTTTATITGGTLNGVYESDIDDISLTNFTGAFTSADVGTDIFVTSNMTLAGSAAANYSLAQPTLFGSITEKTLPEDAIQTIAQQTYTGSNITPSVTVMDNLKALVENTDYTLSFMANRNVGTATVQVIGKGNYTGTANTTFTILPKLLSNSMIAEIPNKIYTNSPITPDVVVQDDTRYLVQDTDYTVSYANNTSPGIGSAIITGKGNYSGTATAYFLISEPKHIEDLEILPISDQIHTGNALTPLVTIKDGEKILVEGIDYTIDKYTNNIGIGTALVQISGKDLYSGMINVAFTIIASETPIIYNHEKPSIMKIMAQTTGNTIALQNLPPNTKVELYNLQGKRIYLGNSGNSQILRIQVQTKGIYFVKVRFGNSGGEFLRVPVK